MFLSDIGHDVEFSPPPPFFTPFFSRLNPLISLFSNQNPHMFKRLQDKWKVNGWQLFLILCTFALGGSLTGFLGKKVMGLLGIEQAYIYVPVYLVVITLIWPVMVLLVSIPLGQFPFFQNYLRRLGRKIARK